MGKHIKRLTAMLNRQYRRGDQQVQDLIHAEAHISARLRQWVGASYDPELFSVQQANSALANLD